MKRREGWEESLVRAIFFIPLLLVLVSCSTSGERLDDSNSTVRYVHDDEHGVGCWIFGEYMSSGKAISCLPDSEYSE